MEFGHSIPLSPRFCLLALGILWVLLATSFRSLFPWTLTPPTYVADPSHLLTVCLTSRSHWLEPGLLRDYALRWARNNPLIAKEEAYASRPSLVRGPAGRENVLSAKVTPGTFELLGIHPSLGRTFQLADSVHCPNCAVLSNALWTSQFHGDNHVIGRWLSVNGRQVEIIGVLPAQFRFPGLDVGLYTPFGTGTHPLMPMFEWPGVLLRVPAGVGVAKAKREIESYVNQTNGLPSNIKLDVLSLKDLEHQSLESCAALIAFTLLLLLAFNWRTAVRLRATGPHRTVAEFLRWWLFFVAKTILLLMIVLIVSLDLVQMAVLRLGGHAQQYAGGAVMWLFLVGLTVALSWSIRDQLARCRTCLRRLRIQVDLGGSSSVAMKDMASCIYQLCSLAAWIRNAGQSWTIHGKRCWQNTRPKLPFPSSLRSISEETERSNDACVS